MGTFQAPLGLSFLICRMEINQLPHKVLWKIKWNNTYNRVSYCWKGKGWCHISICISETEKNDWHIVGAQLTELNWTITYVLRMLYEDRLIAITNHSQISVTWRIIPCSCHSLIRRGQLGSVSHGHAGTQGPCFLWFCHPQVLHWANYNLMLDRQREWAWRILHDPWVGKIPRRWEWLRTPVLLS